MDPSPALNLAQLLIFSLIANLPLGYLREGSPRFSLRWLIYIHLSVPFIILLRLTHGFSWGVIPFSLACAVFGQFVGGRMYRRKKR